jgi:hypothetical protein
MNGWELLLGAGVCACAVLVFLRAVAGGVDEANAKLRGWEDRAKTARQTSG